MVANRILTNAATRRFRRTLENNTPAPSPSAPTTSPESFLKDQFNQLRVDLSAENRRVLEELIGKSIEQAESIRTERDKNKQAERREQVSRTYGKKQRVFTKRAGEVNEELLAAEIDALASWTLARASGLTPENIVDRMASKTGEDAYSEAQIEHLRRSFRADSLEDGGAWVPEQIANTMIEYRREALIPYRRAMVAQLNKGSIKFPKQNSVPLVYWVGEQVAPSATKFKTGTQTMSLRKLAGLAVMSNESLQQIDGLRERFLNQLRRSVAHEAQRAFFFGEGTEYRPLGIYQQTAASQKVQRTKAGASSTYQEIVADLIKMQVKLASDYGDGNGSFELSQAVWLMNHVTRGGLLKTLDGSGQYAFFSEMMRAGSLFGCAFDVTDATPRVTTGTALTGGSNSILGLIDYSQITIAEGRSVSVKVADQATVTDSAGNSINLFTQDSTALLTIVEQDQLLHYDRAAVWLYDVDWMSI